MSENIDDATQLSDTTRLSDSTQLIRQHALVRRHAPGIRTTHRHDPKHRVGAAVRCAA